MNPLTIVLVACGAVIAAVWVLSLATREYSWTDRIWSITPIFFVGCFAFDRGGADPRLNLMTLLVFLWGARLTFNFARKGGYRKGGEDYRWAELRSRMSPFQYQLFNFAFIAGYQNFLLALLALPAWAAWSQSEKPLGGMDFIAAGLFLVFLLGETVADEQQWALHEEKRRRRERGETVEREFQTTGLFRFSRHPNFFCEQGMWWSIYLFGVAAGANWINLSIVGPALLTLLFHGSARFTEELSLRKYPAYAEYQRITSRMIPWGRSTPSE